MSAPNTDAPKDAGSRTIDFWKYEGTANDFIVVEGDAATLDLDPHVVARLCDRHRGIGADGVLLVTPAKGPDAQARMVVRNADGSRPEMCGNGLRCVALHVCTRLAEARSIVVETDSGLRTCKVDMTRNAAGEAEWFVTVDMGKITVREAVKVTFGGREVSMLSVDAGNPHAVTLEPLEDDEVDELGAQLQASEPFPKGVNLERVVMRPAFAAAAIGVTVGVTVYERGVGRTLACGTGACAVAAALVARGEAKANQPVTVILPGGPLEIIIDDQGVAAMRGQARRVFAGRVLLAANAWIRSPAAGEA